MQGDLNSLNTWSTIRLSVLETTNPFVDVALSIYHPGTHLIVV